MAYTAFGAIGFGTTASNGCKRSRGPAWRWKRIPPTVLYFVPPKLSRADWSILPHAFFGNERTIGFSVAAIKPRVAGLTMQSPPTTDWLPC